MAELLEIVEYMNELLEVAEIPDYPNALNGLQLTSARREVRAVSAAVDASEQTLCEAAEWQDSLLIVHHGLFWQGLRPITDAYFRKVQRAMHAGLAVYSAHIPLDIHPELGNNALLAKELGFPEAEPFFPWKGIQLGLRVDAGSMTLAELVSRAEHAVGGGVHVTGGAGSEVGTLGIITGGAGSEVEAMAGEGITTFLTGEGAHWTAPLAHELGVNLLYAGHYATETFGVRALAARVAGEFGLAGPEFIDHPTGL